MWFLVSGVKGSKYYEADSQIDNRIMVPTPPTWS